MTPEEFIRFCSQKGKITIGEFLRLEKPKSKQVDGDVSFGSLMRLTDPYERLTYSKRDGNVSFRRVCLKQLRLLPRRPVWSKALDKALEIVDIEIVADFLADGKRILEEEDTRTVADLDYGELAYIKTIKPCYRWTVNGMKLLFDSEAELMNQEKFRELCLLHLRLIPKRISDDAWFGILNKALDKIKAVRPPSNWTYVDETAKEKIIPKNFSTEPLPEPQPPTKYIIRGEKIGDFT